MNFDVAIVGGGPGGYVCAIRCAQLGLKVALIEKEHMGGTCLNKGCIPTKSLLQATKIKHSVDVAKNFGINAKVESIDFTKIISRSKDVVSGLGNGVSGLMKKNNVSVINGEAKFIEKNKLIVNNKDEISAQNIVIATGASPRMLPDIDSSLIDKGLIWTSKEAMFTENCPSKMLVIGSGAIGIEFASFYNSIGVDVTVVEIQNQILPLEDREASTAAQKALEKHGIKFLLGTSAKTFEEKNEKLSVTFSNEKTDIFDVCLVAIGVVPNTQSLNLDKIGLTLNKNGSISINEYTQTSVENIYAIGDVANVPLLAHKASKEGILCAEKIAGVANIQKIKYEHIPSCTYSNPQIASIGITEEEVQSRGLKTKIGRAYFRGNGKAQAVGETDGFVKVIFDAKTGELLGAHMVGYEVTELIPIFSVAISAELTEKELIQAIFPHPTMSECLQEAVLSAFSIGIHS